MYRSEFCELWWGEGDRPRLTFYGPMGGETVAIVPNAARGDTDEWDAMRGTITELALAGWQLMSSPQTNAGLFFKRALQ